MSSLADLPEIVGFFSYSREDDSDSHGSLSALRNRIQGELRGQLGRTAKTFRLWQDKEAIPSGTLWETEINNAVAQAVFFIPIITPTVVASPYCRFELEAFIAREAAFGRSDLIFPILYIDVPALQDRARRDRDAILSSIAKRQYVDWRGLRHRDIHSAEIKEAVERFCVHIRDALYKPWVSPDERMAQERAAALQQEDEKKRQEAEARQREDEARQAAEARQRDQAEREDTRRKEDALRIAEAERQAEEEQRRRNEAGARRLASEEEERSPGETQTAHPPLRSRPVLLVGLLIAMMALVVGGGMWLLRPHSTQGELAPTAAPALAQERALKPKDIFKECANCPEMVALSKGTFSMGSPRSEARRQDDEEPQHLVAIAQPLAVGRFSVTRVEFAEFVSRTGYKIAGCSNWERNGLVEKPDLSWLSPGYGQDDRHPVVCVSWNDAMAFVDWLSTRTGKQYRLLTEAEWEYAARAGNATRYFFGNNDNEVCRYGNGADQTGKKTFPTWTALPCSDGYVYTAQVGSFLPNDFGLYDMLGNTWQWVADCYRAKYPSDAISDGSAWTSSDCKSHVIRGGSWLADPLNLRAAARGSGTPGLRINDTGFRVARTLTP